MSENNKNLADIKDLSVSFMTDAGSIKAVEDVNFTIPRKTVVGVVGESVICLSPFNLLTTVLTMAIM